MSRSCSVTNSEPPYGGGLAVSPDGFVRLPLCELMSLRLTHHLSGLDDDLSPVLVEGGVQVSISGYTEWLSRTSPVVTVGWDWRLHADPGGLRYVRDGAPRSNVMLIDATSGADLGDAATEIGIIVWMDQSAWQNEVHQHIGRRYS